MKILSNTIFNYETNFSSFVKNEKNFKILMHIFIIISVVVVSILVSTKVSTLLYEYVFRFFVPFKIIHYLTDFFQDFVFSGNSKAFSEFQNLFTDYRRYVYGIIILFTIEKIRLFMRYFYTIRKWDRFSLSYGIYENNKFLKVKKELLSTLGNVLSFGVSLVVFFVIITFAIYKQLQKKFDFQNNFMFEGMVFALFFWLAIVIFFALNIYQRIHNYYRNYLKNNVINQKKDAWQSIKSLMWHYLLNIFGFVIISLNYPIDLFLMFMTLKFIPFRAISSRLWENRASIPERFFLPFGKVLNY
ncbi:hypothetical protein MSUIS_00050 [Mycoplasma suis KI3806]|uniref:Uncharacterized protein n=1 Tax=Mycoplasma suis (strain KI_3806) TaxID=708248 RepID=F0V2M6_MYCS3|nr:hypothetical protein [Mycoplasma suis]CBZ40098.1 hypothetical protein MSUIS_00050 [Mycoplasma suis KI3806]